MDKALASFALPSKAIHYLQRLVIRFRYPVSLPEEVAEALGLEMTNNITFDKFLERLCCPSCCPHRLTRFMPREMAEELFTTALRRESFKYHTLISYYFKGGWLEFVLYFDEQSQLRRLYIKHKSFKTDSGREIVLK